MPTRDGKKKSNNRRSEEGWINGVYTINGASSNVSRNKPKIGENSYNIGSTVRTDENRINEASWFDPIDETSPKMRMAGPEESKNERKITDCPDGVCPVPWATKDEKIEEKAEESHLQHHFDNVNRPLHYAVGSIECIDAIEAQLSEEEFRGYLKGNIIKYIWREQHKGKIESLKKAQWYLNRLTKLGS